MCDMQETIDWKISVPIFKNSIIIKQLIFAVGIPFGLVALMIMLLSGRSRDTLYALGIISILLILTWLFIRVVYQGKYEVEFILDQKVAVCRTQKRQAKKNQIINSLTVILGLLTGRPASAGAGLLAQSRQETFLRWKQVTRITLKPRSHTILLHGVWSEQIALFCTENNYSLVEQFVIEKVHSVKEVRRK